MRVSVGEGEGEVGYVDLVSKGVPHVRAQLSPCATFVDPFRSIFKTVKDRTLC